MSDFTVELVRATGESVVLGDGNTDEPLLLLQGSQGLGVAPQDLSLTPVLAGHGAVLRGARSTDRDIKLPVLVDTNSFDDCHTQLARLQRILNPLNPTEHTVRVSRSGQDGWREIQVRYAGGLEDQGEAYYGTWCKVGIELKAPGALWRGEPVQISQQVAPARKPFLSLTEPFFPVILASSTVAGRVSVDIAGEAPTFPVWTVTPPGEDLLIRNLTTGARLFLSGVINGQTVVDMAAGRVYSATTGTNLNDRLSIDSRFFELAPGLQELEFSMVGATAVSMLDLAYAPRYLSGY